MDCSFASWVSFIRATYTSETTKEGAKVTIPANCMY